MFLVVVRDFARYVRGEAITAAEDIKHALEHHAEKVVQVATPAAPDAPVETAVAPETAPEASHEG